ncbi:MAG TPA: hypothetical protein DCQ06_03450, partial [Myxococcales bacterium]|nr:hypothetical protein [Myxococcales bacterium]
MWRSFTISVCLLVGALSSSAHGALSLPEPVTPSIISLWTRYPAAKALAEAVTKGQHVRALKLARGLVQRPTTPVALQTYARWVLLKAAKARGDQQGWRTTLEALAKKGPLRMEATRQLISTELRRGHISVALRLMNTIEASHPEYGRMQLRRLRFAIDIGDLRVAKNAVKRLNPATLASNKLACYWFHL